MQSSEDNLVQFPVHALAPEHYVTPHVAKRVLVADDEPGIRYILERALSSAGYAVSCASDGEEAWSALCKENFDLLVTDHDMPNLTGVNLVRRLRAFSSSLPVLLVSGQTPWEIPDLLEILRPGFAIEKPFSFSELLGHVNHLASSPRADSAGARQGRETGSEQSEQRERPAYTFADINPFVHPVIRSLQAAR